MRDPAVHAIHALHMTPDEVAAVREGRPIYRSYWPPVYCRDSIVGLSAAGVVTGEARMLSTARTTAGVEWRFAAMITYRKPLAHTATRGMASSMPEAPMGTLAPARDWDTYD